MAIARVKVKPYLDTPHTFSPDPAQNIYVSHAKATVATTICTSACTYRRTSQNGLQVAVKAGLSASDLLLRGVLNSWKMCRFSNRIT